MKFNRTKLFSLIATIAIGCTYSYALLIVMPMKIQHALKTDGINISANYITLMFLLIAGISSYILLTNTNPFPKKNYIAKGIIEYPLTIFIIMFSMPLALAIVAVNEFMEKP